MFLIISDKQLPTRIDKQILSMTIMKHIL